MPLLRRRACAHDRQHTPPSHKNPTKNNDNTHAHAPRNAKTTARAPHTRTQHTHTQQQQQTTQRTGVRAAVALDVLQEVVDDGDRDYVAVVVLVCLLVWCWVFGWGGSLGRKPANGGGLVCTPHVVVRAHGHAHAPNNNNPPTHTTHPNHITQQPSTTHPMFSPLVRHWNATPATRPPSSTGPPLLPLLIAASIWMPSSSAAPCTYEVT